ncbi:MAG: hypothetical protein M1365_09045 [Actinobacteria bacterium]|nr:hypothetical protein [Actinomycetota bacterium]
MATKTFLIDWCFLNPKLQNRKELCDLLVVFDDTAIIWQIKDLKLDKNNNYKKTEVNKNLRQLAGARRQLFELKTPIPLKNIRRSEEIFDSLKMKHIFLISVLLGEGEDVFQFTEEIKNNKVHVFARVFTQIVLNELDTVSDFINYLKAKELFLDTEKSIIIMGGEEEFLARYLIDSRSFDSFKNSEFIVIKEGLWKNLQNDSAYKAKKKEDRISYGWDSIINRAHEGSIQYEFIARELARPNRFHRRYLSKVFFEDHIIAHKTKEGDLYRCILSTDGVTYCFLFHDEPEPRINRKNMLFLICWIARGMYKENKKIIGIATEMKIRPTCSYDFVLRHQPDWTEEDQIKMEKLQKDIGIFVNPIVKHTHEDEYPQVNK